MTTLPDLKPSPARLALVHGVAQKQVRHYPWDEPATFWRTNHGLDEHKVTSRVAELVRTGLAAYGHGIDGLDWRRVDLTDAGWAWLDRHGGQPKEAHT